MSNTIEYHYDQATGIVRVEGVGLWTLAQIKDHFARFTTTLRDLRASGIAIRVLVDISRCAVQQPDVAELIQSSFETTYRRGDRVAMVVASSIVKMQTRRLVDNDLTAIFVSANAAEIWLMAYDEKPHAA